MSEPFEDLEKTLDSLEEEMKTKSLMISSIVVIGQSMANILKEYLDGATIDKHEAQEFVTRWEKEFR